MINSTSSATRAVHTGPVAAIGQTPVKPTPPRSDQLSTESAAFLREALARQPEIRPEMVERGRTLAADPEYPSVDVLRKVGAAILSAPDLADSQT